MLSRAELRALALRMPRTPPAFRVRIDPHEQWGTQAMGLLLLRMAAGHTVRFCPVCDPEGPRSGFDGWRVTPLARCPHTVNERKIALGLDVDGCIAERLHGGHIVRYLRPVTA